MITAGIDVASQTAHTAACVIDWADDGARVTRVSVGVDDDSITELITGVDKVGIDAPLGWPIAFADAMTQHTRDGSWPSTYQHADTSAFRLRATDVWVWKRLGMRPPLSVSTDRISLAAMRIAALLSRLPERTALDGSGVVVEVYPAAALDRWGLPSRRYKRRENSEARRVLVERFLAETRQWLSVGETDANLCLSSDDSLDALMAALVARAAAVGLVEPIQPEDRASAAREGWIAVPSPGSLPLLALGREI